MYILGANMYILGAKYILGDNMSISGANMLVPIQYVHFRC